MVVVAVAHNSALLLPTEALELVCDCSTEEAGVGDGFADSATAPAGGIGAAEKLAIGAVEAGYRDSQRRDLVKKQTSSVPSTLAQLGEVGVRYLPIGELLLLLLSLRHVFWQLLRRGSR